MVEENLFLLSAKSIKINTTKFSSHRPKKNREEVVSTHLKKWTKSKNTPLSLVCIGPKLLLPLGQIHA